MPAQTQSSSRHRRSAAPKGRIFGLACLSFSLLATAVSAQTAPNGANPAKPPAAKGAAKPDPAAEARAAKAAAAQAEESALKAALSKADRNMVDDATIAVIRQGAEAGSGPAAQKLGYLYLTGIGMEMNYPQAYRWYCVAALRNVPFAVDTAFKIFSRMTPSARTQGENLVSTSLTPSEIARLIAMRPPPEVAPKADPASADAASK
jgi:hypothetical protein